MSATAVFTRAEVAKHNQKSDCWLIIGDGVYNVTKFIDLHPGGVAYIMKYAGQDATKEFTYFHPQTTLDKYKRLRIGNLAPADITKAPKRPVHLPGSFGDMVPYGDPAWYQRFKSPYYKPTHVAFRAKLRAFIETVVMPTLPEWGDGGKPPKDLYRKIGEAGYLACMNGPPFPSKYLPAGIQPPEDFDHFHELIVYDEFARISNSAAFSGLTNGPAIGMSAIMFFGSEEMKRRLAPDVFLGREFIALAISEPNAGSDVAAVSTVAVKDGDHYVLNGLKKWITNGMYAKYFVVAARTGAKGGHNSLSLFVVERETPGFNIRKINIPRSDSSGTALLEFYNVRIPAANLIGKENHGFKYIMYNFNHERMYINVAGCRLARVCLEESIKYAAKRIVFGKPLSEQAAIRQKIACMAQSVEQLQAWIELVTYQLCKMTHEEANIKLGDVICLIKAQMSKTLEFCARETTHIFGGNALQQGGLGYRIEHMVGTVKGYAIPAGAEDVMQDFAARQMFRMAKGVAKM